MNSYNTLTVAKVNHNLQYFIKTSGKCVRDVKKRKRAGKAPTLANVNVRSSSLLNFQL